MAEKNQVFLLSPSHKFRKKSIEKQILYASKKFVNVFKPNELKREGEREPGR